jgi:hypothetical protein
MAGAPTKLTDGLAEKILEYLRVGHYRSTAAELCGIHETTMSRWMGYQTEPYRSFQAAVREAEAHAINTQLEKITSSPEPADAKWYLARKKPDQYAETRRVDLTGRFDVGTRLSIDTITDPAAQKALITLLGTLDSEGDAGTQPADEGSDQ